MSILRVPGGPSCSNLAVVETRKPQCVVAYMLSLAKALGVA